MRIVADMHTHTVASGHGYSTVLELAAEARDKGLSAIAITDHGPALPGGPHYYHFAAMRFIPRKIHGVLVLRGVEANILSADGSVDLEDKHLAALDFVMAGLHEEASPAGATVDEYTQAVVAAMTNPRVRAISHPGNPAFPVDYERIVREAARTGTAIEINNASFSYSRGGSAPNCRTIARLAAAARAPIVIGSDAHVAPNVGSFEDAIRVVVEAGIPEEQVVNSSLERLLAFLHFKE